MLGVPSGWGRVARIVGGTNGLLRKHQEGSVVRVDVRSWMEKLDGTVELRGSAGRKTSASYLWGGQERASVL